MVAGRNLFFHRPARHQCDAETAFDHQRQIADLDYLTNSCAAMTSLAEQYVGLPPEVSFESAGLNGA